MFQRMFQNQLTRGECMTQVIENIGGEYRNRTGVHGFAIRCVTTPPTRRPVVGALLTDHEEGRKTHMRVKMRSGRCRWPGNVAHHSSDTLNE